MDAGAADGAARGLPLPRGGSGKVREWWSLPGGRRLILTTDRISAFDRVLGEVAGKGQILNELSAWWFAQTADLVPNHLLAVPDPNVSVVVEAEAFPIEVIVRGRITGVTSTSLWRRYELGERRIYGYSFPEGLRKNEALPAPIVTPTTKGGAGGHDERLDWDEVVPKGLLDALRWKEVMDVSLGLFERGRDLARRAGLVLVDTKYEFGLGPDGRLLLIDEVHTPDSSRFWRLSGCEERIAAGLEPEVLDKEYLRLAFAELGYRGEGEPPRLPAEIWEGTAKRYAAVYEALLGAPFRPAPGPLGPRLLALLEKEGLA